MWCKGNTLALGAWVAVRVRHLLGPLREIPSRGMDCFILKFPKGQLKLKYLFLILYIIKDR